MTELRIERKGDAMWMGRYDEIYLNFYTWVRTGEGFELQSKIADSQSVSLDLESAKELLESLQEAVAEAEAKAKELA